MSSSGDPAAGEDMDRTPCSLWTESVVKPTHARRFDMMLYCEDPYGVYDSHMNEKQLTEVGAWTIC